MGRWRKPAPKAEQPEIERVELRPSSRESTLWASRLTIDSIAALVTISMSKTGLTDDDMERWCCWLRHHLAQPHCTLGLVDFAENRLTAKGVRHLLATFLELQLPVQVLKLHHNRIAEGSCFAAYLQRGWLHELHLSHNELDAQASAAIIEAAVQARDESAKIYPRKVGKGNSSPLWVRLEQNYIDPTVFSAILDAKFGPDASRICCDARSKWCTPHNCIQQAAFVVHLKNLLQQRRRGSAHSQAQPASVGTTIRRADGSECAHVLCFDWERGSWVPESIEIPAIDPTATAAMTEGLKVLIGAGMSRPTDRETPNDKQLTLSQEEGQSMGADLLHSIRKKPTVAPPVAPPAVPLVSVQAARQAAAQAAAAQAAAAQAHMARVAAHLACRERRLEEDPKAWLRIEAPVFHPGARCFFATSEAREAPESQVLSAETSAGAASDDTESVEVTAGSAGASTIDVEAVDTGRSNTASPSKRWEDQSSPAQWLSRAAPPLEDLPATSLWKATKYEAKSVMSQAKGQAPVSRPEGFSTTPVKEGLSKLDSPAPGQQSDAFRGTPTSAAKWLSDADAAKVPEKWSEVFPSAPRPVAPQKIEAGLSDSSEAKSVQKTVSAAVTRSGGPPPEPVPPEIEKPLVVHEERPEVVGQQDEATDRPEEVQPIDPETLEVQALSGEPESVTPPVELEVAKADSQADGSTATCGKETQEFPTRARVHQVFNILDEETRGRSRTDSSPRVLEVWKEAASTATPEASPVETSKQGQCHVM